MTNDDAGNRHQNRCSDGRGRLFRGPGTNRGSDVTSDIGGSASARRRLGGCGVTAGGFTPMFGPLLGERRALIAAGSIHAAPWTGLVSLSRTVRVAALKNECHTM